MIVREFSRASSNWRSQQVTDKFVDGQNPRPAPTWHAALVRHLRTNGVMRGVINARSEAEGLVTKAQAMPKIDSQDLAKVVSTKNTYVWETGKH